MNIAYLGRFIRKKRLCNVINLAPMVCRYPLDFGQFSRLSGALQYKITLAPETPEFCYGKCRPVRCQSVWRGVSVRHQWKTDFLIQISGTDAFERLTAEFSLSTSHYHISEQASFHSSLLERSP